MKVSVVLVVSGIALLQSVNAQNGKLLSEQSIHIKNLPFYESISTMDNNGNQVLSQDFSYLDDVRFDSIRYQSDGMAIAGYLMRPKQEGKYPCIIFNRGGNRDFGALSEALMIFHLSYLVQNGYIVVASNYRGNSKSEGNDQFGGEDVHDILNLLPLLGQLPNADTSNVGMYGWSRGGMMTFLALKETTSNQIKTAIVGSGPTDMALLIKDRPEMESNVMAKLIPDYEKDTLAALKSRSVVEWADQLPKEVPLFILHGRKDWRVSPLHASRLAEKLSENRIPYRLVIFEDGTHGLNEHHEEYRSMVLNWFNKYLKNDSGEGPNQTNN